jgi:hypothetical protein
MKTLIDVFIDGVALYQIENEYFVLLLSYAIHATNALLDAHRVPRHIVVDYDRHKERSIPSLPIYENSRIL